MQVGAAPAGDRRGTASAPGSARGARTGPLPLEFTSVAPRLRQPQRALSDMAGLHPNVRVARLAANAPPASLTMRIYDLLDAHLIDEDEGSDVAEGRLNSLGQELFEAGHSPAACEAAINHE